MNVDILNAAISLPQVNAYTYPCGPRGVGISSVTQDDNRIILTFDDNRVTELAFPAWWFGTKEEYALLTYEQKQTYFMFFILDDI